MWLPRLNLGLAGSECSESLQFGAAFFAKGTQWIYRMALHQLSHLRKGLIRRKIRVDNHSNDRLCLLNHGGTGQHAHSAYRGVDADQRRHLRFIMDESVGIQLRSLIDERAVELLPPGPVSRESCGAALAMQAEPS